jgi:hypothetical protein
MSIKTYDFRAFCRGELVQTDVKSNSIWLATEGVGLTSASLQKAALAAPPAVYASISSIDHAFDPVIQIPSNRSSFFK